jgi:plasmid stability protein
MRSACYCHAMSAIQIKHVPDELHRRLRDRARRHGVTLSRYALEVLERDLKTPTTDEWLSRIARDEPTAGVSSEEIADLIREGRAERDEQILRALADRD